MRRLALIAAALCVSATVHAQEPIRIGLPLELSGRLVYNGSAALRATKMAAAAFHNTINGHPIELVIRDTQSDPQIAIASVNELAGQMNLNYMIGPVSTAMVSVVIPAWRRTKPVWVISAGTQQLEQQASNEPNFFHIYPYAYEYYATEAKGLAASLGAGKTVSVVYADDAYGRTSLDAVRNSYPANGLKIVSEESIRPGTSDMSAAMTKLRAQRPDIIVALLQANDLVNFTKQSEIAHLPSPYLVDSADIMFEEWQKAVGKAQEDWVGIAGYVNGLKRDADPTRPDIFPSSGEWEKRFRDMFGTEPTYLDVLYYGGAAMLMLGIEKAGADDRGKVAAAMSALDVQTPAGRGKFVPTGNGTLNQAFQDFLVVQRQGGQNIIIYPPEVATGKLAARP